MSAASVTWVTAMLDTREEDAEAAEEFWASLTGSTLSQRRGPHAEFATLPPDEGDSFLKVQRVGRPVPGGLHLDLHTDDVASLASRVRELGGSTGQPHDGYVVCGSPRGLTFCIVEHSARVRPSPHRWTGGRSIVDQVCLDIPPGAYDVECAFWRDLTGWTHTPGDVHDEFTRLVRPEGQPLAFLLQRLDDEAPAVSAHLDWSADDREAETDRHVALGARLLRRHEWWTVLEDPAGRTYCITARRPGDV